MAETIDKINGIIYECKDCQNRCIETGDKGYLPSNVLCGECGNPMKQELVKGTK